MDSKEKEAIWPGPEGLIPALPKDVSSASWHTRRYLDEILIGYEFYKCKFYQNPMTEQECRDEEEQLKAIPGISPAIIGFVCSSGFDFKPDRYRMITGEDLFR